ncbi:MAG: hypothetical protein ACTSUE_01080 [Promethearchaeota archaeon]
MNKKRLIYYIFFIVATGILIYLIPIKLIYRTYIFSFILLISVPRLLLTSASDRAGVWNPPPLYQRYRLSEYSPRKPFFQWWYFSLKDYENNTAFAFCYSMTHTVKDEKNGGAYMLFAAFSKKLRCHIYYKFPMDQFTRENDFDIEIGDTFSLKVMKDGDTGLRLRLKGKMDNSNNVWVNEGLGKEATISWDLDVSRIIGWYGQDDIEPGANRLGLISWNTYAYDSEVNGSVEVNGEVHEFTKSPRFRMYCDMNWGERFPGQLTAGKDSLEYSWGSGGQFPRAGSSA